MSVNNSTFKLSREQKLNSLTANLGRVVLNSFAGIINDSALTIVPATSKILKPEESGIWFINKTAATTNLVITLPKPAPGLYYKFIITGGVTASTYLFTDGTADQQGFIANTATIIPLVSATTLTSLAAMTPGTTIEFLAVGSKWNVSTFSAAVSF